MRKFLLVLFALIASTGIAMAGGHMKNLVETAAGNDAFKTLVAAVKAAGLVETLAGKGPFTVFAPTNEAFAKLPEGTVESLLKPENKDKLISILTYHVIPGKVMSKDIKPSQMVKTVNGQQVSIKLSYGKVSVDGANVTATDVEADNGVIHVIDSAIHVIRSNTFLYDFDSYIHLIIHSSISLVRYMHSLIRSFHSFIPSIHLFIHSFIHAFHFSLHSFQ